MPITSTGLSKEVTQQQILDILGTAPVYEVDSVSVGAATAGSVTLSFTWDGNVYTTGTIAFNAIASTVAGAVQAATAPGGFTLPASAVAASGGPLATSPIVLTFQNQMVGPVTGQTITPTGLTGGTAAFTRTIAGSAGGLAGSISTFNGGVNPGQGLAIVLRGSDGKMYMANGIGASEGGVALQVYLGGGSSQGNRGSGAPTAALQVGFRDSAGNLNGPNIDTAGALRLQSSVAPGTPTPSLVNAIGGSDGTNLRPVLTDSSGRVIVGNNGAIGVAAPGVIGVIGGVDGAGNTRAVSISATGAIAIQDSSTVPGGPLSINGVANPQGANGVAWTGANSNTGFAVTGASQTFLPDSTGGSSINGQRAQVEIMASAENNVDVWVAPTATTVVGNLYCIRPGGSLSLSHSGPCAVIHNSKLGSTTVGSPSAKISFAEWA